MSIVSALFKIQSTQVFPRTFRQIRRIPANCNPAGREPPPLAPPLGELAAPLGAPLRGRHAAKKTVFPSLWYPLSQPDGCQLSQRESQEALPYLPANLSGCRGQLSGMLSLKNHVGDGMIKKTYFMPEENHAS